MNPHRFRIVPIIICLSAALQAKDAPSRKPQAVVRPWPEEDKAAGFTVEQVGEDPVKTFTVTAKQTGEKCTFKAINRGGPNILVPHNGWPQIGLINDGPPEFLWRRLYRIENGAYRCVRIDELTRMPFHAPADAPMVEIEPGYELHFLRSRDTKEGDAEDFEEFTTETPSPDGKTTVTFHYAPNHLAKVDVAPTQSKDQAQLLSDMEEDGFSGSWSFALWGPDNGAVALYVRQAMRVGATTVFIKKGDKWTKAELPEVELPFDENDFSRVHSEFIEPVKWDDARTLVTLYHGGFRGEDVPYSYAYHVKLRWGKDGKARVASIKPASSEDEREPVLKGTALRPDSSPH